MASTRRGEGAPRGRFLVAMRPESATAENAVELARLLGLKPEQLKDMSAGALPRIIASRSSLEEAESLARVLTARGRKSVAWDRESPQAPLFQAERVTLEGDQFVFEQRVQGWHFILARDVQSIVDLRLRLETEVSQKVLFGRAQAAGNPGQQVPDRALLIVPDPAVAWPAVLSSRTVDTGKVLFPEVAASKLLQEAVTRARALVPDRVIEVRTSASALGFQKGDGDPLEWVLQLFARLPPLPAGARPVG